MYIPKGKGWHPLGIPAVKDRVVQAALKLVIEPIFEHEFEARSFGFRQGLGCKDALREVGFALSWAHGHMPSHIGSGVRAFLNALVASITESNTFLTVQQGVGLCNIADMP